MNDKEKLKDIHKMAQIALGKQITLSCTEYAIKEGFFDNLIALYNANYRKQKQGKWITRNYENGVYCSECNEFVTDESNYCPNCGAKNKE